MFYGTLLLCRPGYLKITYGISLLQINQTKPKTMKTRKLKDLKENEVIFIKTEKEAEKINKFLYNHNVDWHMAGSVKSNPITNKFSDDGLYLFDIAENSMCYSNTNKQIKKKHTVYPASDFIKPKKSKLAKLKKQVYQEISKLDSEIHDIKLFTGMKKHEVDPIDWPASVLGYVAIKNLEKSESIHKKAAKADVSKTEITELPKLWCVKDNEIVSKWAAEKFECRDTVSDEGTYLHVGTSKLFNDYAFERKILKGYTPIQQSDFERLVLNQEPIGNTEQLEEQPKDIDFSVPGQLLIHKISDIVCVTSGEVFYTDLSGVKVFSGLNVLTNEFRNDWIQENFTRFTGELTIKND